MDQETTPRSDDPRFIAPPPEDELDRAAAAREVAYAELEAELDRVKRYVQSLECVLSPRIVAAIKAAHAA